MSQNSKEILIKNIKALREKLKLTREELSLLLDFDNSYISKLESGKVNITLESMDKIADFFEVETPFLITKIKSNEPEASEFSANKNKNLRMKLAKNITKFRKRKKMEQSEMSLLAGLSVSYIGKLEKGQINITLDKVVQIADFLKIDVDELLK